MTTPNTTPAPVLIATIHEASEFTLLGAVSVFMICVTAIITVFNFFLAANSIHQAVWGIAGIAALIAFATGAIIGRRRTYRVYRDVHPE